MKQTYGLNMIALMAYMIADMYEADLDGLNMIVNV